MAGPLAERTLFECEPEGDAADERERPYAPAGLGEGVQDARDQASAARPPRRVFGGRCSINPVPGEVPQCPVPRR